MASDGVDPELDPDAEIMPQGSMHQPVPPPVPSPSSDFWEYERKRQEEKDRAENNRRLRKEIRDILGQ